MRTLTPAFREALEAGATTLARCWTLRRADGVVLGFTDHDRDILVDGVVHAAGTGLDAADHEAQLGFAPGGGEVAGALSAPGLAEADLAAGRWDDASVTVWLVDWSDPAQRVLLDTGTIGEVSRADAAFTAELRSIAHRLDAPRGRLYQAACSADLGDARCTVSLAAAHWSGQATVTATDGAAWITAAGLAGRADGLFSGGRLTFQTGANAGLALMVRNHRSGADAARLELWEPTSAPVVAGDAFAITAGCDRSYATCRDRFANTVNFRGFPHIPGNDFALQVIREGDSGLDGGSLFR
jgi:uncharacterized phage protein (TIGR02218 family)